MTSLCHLMIEAALEEMDQDITDEDSLPTVCMSKLALRFYSMLDVVDHKIRKKTLNEVKSRLLFVFFVSTFLFTMCLVDGIPLAGSGSGLFSSEF